MLKKILIISVFLIVSLVTVCAENRYYLATHYTSKTTQGEFSEWVQTEVPVFLDTTRKRIVISSRKEQVIDYIALDQTKDKNSVQLKTIATDSNYQKIIVTFIATNDGLLFLLIEYNDYQYMYSLVDITDQQ